MLTQITVSSDDTKLVQSGIAHDTIVLQLKADTFGKNYTLLTLFQKM